MHCVVDSPANNLTFSLSTGVPIRASGLIIKSGMSGTMSEDKVSDVVNWLWVNNVSRVMYVKVRVETICRTCVNQTAVISVVDESVYVEWSLHNG